MSSDPETPRPEYTTVHEAARHIAAVSSPDCRCTFKRGQLVKLCSLCAAGAEVIERAMTEAIGTALLAFKARAESAEQQLTAARAELDLRRTQMDAFPFCPDHRDKVRNQECFACRLETARAQVIAQVKALLRSLPSLGVTWLLDWQIDTLCVKVAALQPDPSLAVLLVADREQALRWAYKAGEIAGFAAADTDDNPDSTIDSVPHSAVVENMASARKLLHLPQEPGK